MRKHEANGRSSDEQSKCVFESGDVGRGALFLPQIYENTANRKIYSIEKTTTSVTDHINQNLFLI